MVNWKRGSKYRSCDPGKRDSVFWRFLGGGVPEPKPVMLDFSGSRSNVNLTALPRSSSYLRSLTKCCGGRRRRGEEGESLTNHAGGHICRRRATVWATRLDLCAQLTQLLLRHGRRSVRQPPQLLGSLLPSLQSQH